MSKFRANLARKKYFLSISLTMAFVKCIVNVVSFCLGFCSPPLVNTIVLRMAVNACEYVCLMMSNELRAYQT